MIRACPCATTRSPRPATGSSTRSREAKLRLLGEVAGVRAGDAGARPRLRARASCCAAGPSGSGRAAWASTSARSSWPRPSPAPRSSASWIASRSSRATPATTRPRRARSTSPLHRRDVDRRRARRDGRPAATGDPATAGGSSSASRTGSSRRRTRRSRRSGSRPTSSCRSRARWTGSRPPDLELVEMVLADGDRLGPLRGAPVADDRRLAGRQPGRSGPRRDARVPRRRPASLPALVPPLPRLGRVRHPPARDEHSATAGLRNSSISVDRDRARHRAA